MMLLELQEGDILSDSPAKSVMYKHKMNYVVVDNKIDSETSGGRLFCLTSIGNIDVIAAYSDDHHLLDFGLSLFYTQN